MQAVVDSKPAVETVNDVVITFDDVRKHVLRAHYKAMLFDWCDPLHHIIKLKENFDTACWAFLNGKHHIYIGDLVFSCLADDADRCDYIQAFVYHEMAHGRWTSRNLKKVCRLLKEANVNFKLFNLFEDARIEDLWRNLTGNMFGWNSLMQPLSNIDSAVAIFYAFIHTEGDFFEPELEHYERVSEYYQKAISVGSSEGLIPLLVEFVKEFKPNIDDIPDTGLPSSSAAQGEADDENPSNETGDDKPGSIGEYDENIDGDLKFALEVSQNDDLGDIDDDSTLVVDGEADANSEVLSGKNCDLSADIDTGKPSGPTERKEIQRNQSRSNLSHTLLLNTPESFDVEDANNKASIIKSIFLGPKRPIYTDRPSKRFNKRHFANPERRAYVRKQAKGAKRFDLSILVDCSGSMSGEPIANARQIIATFNRLALMGVFKGRVILSSSTVNDFPVLHLPLADDDIGKVANIKPADAEGLERCMKKHVGTLKNSDYVFVITDGNLADSPIDKEFYNSKRIYTIGLYACKNRTPADLSDWFDLGIVRRSLDDLFSAMVNLMKRK